jgi:timeless
LSHCLLCRGRLITNPFKDPMACLPQAKRKRSRRAGAAGGGREVEKEDATLHLSSLIKGPVTVKAQGGLHLMARTFISKVYDPFMKSIKNEFRIDSARLEPGDRILFFRLVTFFLGFYRRVDLWTGRGDE